MVVETAEELEIQNAPDSRCEIIHQCCVGF